MESREHPRRTRSRLRWHEDRCGRVRHYRTAPGPHDGEDTARTGRSRRASHAPSRAARALLRAVAAGASPVAVGASTMGIPGEHGVALAPTLPGWDRFALGRELRIAFDQAEVCLATDVKAAARAEAEQGALVDCDPGIYLNLGTGLAAAIVAGGRVIDGRHGASGEIGYNLRSVADVGLDAADRTPLEDAVSGYALVRHALAFAPESRDAAEVFARAPHNPAVAELLRSFIAELSFHVVNLAIAIDPARIAVGGGMVRSWPLIEAGLRPRLAGGRAVPAGTRHRPLSLRRAADRRAHARHHRGPGTPDPGSTSMGRLTPALATASTYHRHRTWQSPHRSRQDRHHRPEGTVTMRRIKVVAVLVGLGLVVSACSSHEEPARDAEAVRERRPQRRSQARRYGHHLQRTGSDLALPVQPVQPGELRRVARLRLRAPRLRRPAQQ